MSDLKDALAVLELPPKTTRSEVKKAYRQLAKVWHPDRFRGDPDLQAKAEKKLKQINQAYSTVMGHLKARHQGSTHAGPSPEEERRRAAEEARRAREAQRRREQAQQRAEQSRRSARSTWEEERRRAAEDATRRAGERRAAEEAQRQARKAEKPSGVLPRTVTPLVFDVGLGLILLMAIGLLVMASISVLAPDY